MPQIKVSGKNYDLMMGSHEGSLDIEIDDSPFVVPREEGENEIPHPDRVFEEEEGGMMGGELEPLIRRDSLGWKRLDPRMKQPVGYAPRPRSFPGPEEG